METSRLTVYNKLDAYQKKIVQQALKVKTLGIFAEQGTGKTWIAGGIADQLAGNFNLFVVPLTNIDSTWAKFFREQLPHFKVCRTFEALKDCAPICFLTQTPVVLLLHYEALPPIIKKLKKTTWSLIVYDESQRLKNRNTRQSKDASKLRNSAKHKVILTGTPMDGDPCDLWAQFRFLNDNIFGIVWKDFEDEYMEPIEPFDYTKHKKGTFGYQRAFKKFIIQKSRREFDESKHKKFRRKIAPYVMRVTKEDVLDLPDMNIVEEHVTLRNEQRRVYDEMEKDMVAMLSQQRVASAPLKISQIGKLQQVCGGHIFDDEGEVVNIGSAKLRRVITLQRRHKGESIVVFCRYLEEVNAVAEALKDRGLVVATITGRVKKSERAPIIKKFQAGRIDVLVCQIRTGGVGIDLFRSHIAIIYSTTYSFIDFEQAVARLHRRGQEKEVTIYLLIAEMTIDEVIYSAIRSKRKMTNRIMFNLSGEYTWQKKQHRTSMTLTGSRKTLASRPRPSGSRFVITTSISPANRMSGQRPRRTMKSCRS